MESMLTFFLKKTQKTQKQNKKNTKWLIPFFDETVSLF